MSRIFLSESQRQWFPAGARWIATSDDDADVTMGSEDLFACTAHSRRPGADFNSWRLGQQS